MIEMEHVSHAYGSRSVLEDVSLRVARGEVAGLVGPNGAGKTTLMRILATLLRPTAGSVRIGGCDVCSSPELARWVVGFLPERTSLYPELTAWEYLDLFAEMAGQAPAVRKRRIDEALARVSLDDRRDAPTRELSKGLRQRLGLQATLMHDPRVLVLDEPTDGLDPLSRRDVLAEVRELAASGRAVLISSHVLAEIEEVADTVYVLAGGRLNGDDPEPLRRYRIRVRGDLEQARAHLAKQPDVRSAVLDGDRILVDLESQVADPSSLAQSLLARGFALLEMSEEHSRLEERFERAVKGS
jgi:ABC-2 type transport system ATP-binding protein